MRELCEIGPGYSVRVDDLYTAWGRWCGEQGRDHPGTKQTFGIALRTVFPGLKVSQPRDVSGNRERWYEGLRLKH